MAIDKKSRQLSAIVFSDITGYTAMMQKDETASLVLLEKYQKCHEEESEKHNGKIVQYYGDACLMTFNSVVEAMKCSHALQLAFKEDPNVPVRIGVHIGDIVFTNDNVFGDAVNVASRVESMGVPGAILFSETVQKNLTSHPEFTYESVGSFEFKNVEEPLEVFALTNDGLPVPRKEEMKGKLKSKATPPEKRSKVGLLAILAGIIIIAATGWYFLKKSDTPPEEAIVSTPIPIKVEGSNKGISLQPFETGTFKDDRDEQNYKWVKYANGQKWMAQNLNFNQGSAPCYDNKKECSEIGRLYTWNQAMTSCPNGWRLPDNEEWSSLIKTAGGRSVAYYTLMDASLSGFNATLGGSLDDKKNFDNISVGGNYWSAESKDILQAGWINFSANIKDITSSGANKKMAFSCRCIEDLSTLKKSNNAIVKNSGLSVPPKSATKNLESKVRGTISFKIEIVEENKRDADLKIGSKKSPQSYIVNNGDGFVYEFTYNEPNKVNLVTNQRGRGTGIDADLKISSKNTNASTGLSELVVLIISDRPLKNGDLANFKTTQNDHLSIMNSLKKHFDKRVKKDNILTSTSKDQIDYVLDKNEILIAALERNK